MASNLRATASNLQAMASNLLAMASNLCEKGHTTACCVLQQVRLAGSVEAFLPITGLTFNTSPVLLPPIGNDRKGKND